MAPQEFAVAASEVPARGAEGAAGGDALSEAQVCSQSEKYMWERRQAEMLGQYRPSATGP